MYLTQRLGQAPEHVEIEMSIVLIHFVGLGEILKNYPQA